MKKLFSELKCICQSCSYLVNSPRSFCSYCESNWLLIFFCTGHSHLQTDGLWNGYCQLNH